MGATVRRMDSPAGKRVSTPAPSELTRFICVVAGDRHWSFASESGYLARSFNPTQVTYGTLEGHDSWNDWTDAGAAREGILA